MQSDFFTLLSIFYQLSVRISRNKTSILQFLPCYFTSMMKRSADSPPKNMDMNKVLKSHQALLSQNKEDPDFVERTDKIPFCHTVGKYILNIPFCHTVGKYILNILFCHTVGKYILNIPFCHTVGKYILTIPSFTLLVITYLPYLSVTLSVSTYYLRTTSSFKWRSDHIN